MRFPLIVTCLFVASALSAAVPRDGERDTVAVSERHVILKAEHVLLPEERARLAARGVTIVSEAGSRRYVARIGRRDLSGELAIAAIEEIRPQSKIKPSAQRALNGLQAFVRAQIVFHRDVSESRARELVAAVGGAIPGTTFAYPSSSRVIVPRGALATLAEADEVAQVHAVRRKMLSHNVVAGALSRVTPVQNAPYDLIGSGVTIGVGEVSNVDAGHLEFQGRVTALSAGAPDQHATHVVGTVAGAGIRAGTKGMAPGARVLVSIVDNGFLESKESGYVKNALAADNNSWGYIVGWNFSASRTQAWEWWGDEEFGAYGLEAAGLDHLTRASGTFVVYSSGNDGGDTGPTGAPFAHYHDEQETVFCRSADGSGNDCPATPCGSCEKIAHPGDGPFGTMSLLGAAKNVVAVGAITSSKAIARFSSRGPTADGRIKPDVVAKGTSQFSTFPGNAYGNLQGTSMSAPVVTGIAALIIEQWRRSFGGVSPRVEIIRGLLAHGAEDLGNAGPDYTFGFGLANAQAAIDVIRADNATGARIQSDDMTQGLTIEYSVTLPSNSTGRVTLVWNDPENTPYPDEALINDLDLEVVDASNAVIFPYVLDPNTPGTVAARGVNVRDNIEQVDFAAPAGGVFRVRVKGSRIATTQPQPFTIITSHELGDARIACADPFEPNNSVQSAYGRLPQSASLRAGLCDADDTDFYRFVVDRAGTISVRLDANSTPLRVTVTAGALSATGDVAADSSATTQLTIPGSGAITPITVYVQVQPLGTLASNANYSVSATYPSSQSGRNRPVRRP